MRRLVDRQYCCADHRRKRVLSSARALRDAGEGAYRELGGLWGETNGKRQNKNGAHFGAAVAVGVCLLMVAVLWTAPSRSVRPSKVNYSMSASGIGASLRKLLPGWSSVQLSDDFQTGLADWAGERGASQDWTIGGGTVRPGKLRLWKPSLGLDNYRFEFLGEVEQKAMSWAFRAPDLDNYYATKIAIVHAGALPRAEIVRYVVWKGREYNRVQLPLPLSVVGSSNYRVKVSVKGNDFSTSVNGQIVDVWSDSRLPTGGIGFFSQPGEVASVHWVRLTGGEENIWSRLFATAFLLPPSALSLP